MALDDAGAPAPPSLTSRCYDGRSIVTTDDSDTPQTQARLHRWTVRAYLYMNGLNRLPAVSDWKEG